MAVLTRVPTDSRLRVLQLLLAGAVAESFVHYADNTLRFDDYGSDHPPAISSWITQWMIPLSWVLFTVFAYLGYRAFREQRWPHAAAWLGAYSASGLISLLHFVDISPSDLSAFQNTFVFADVVFGVAVLTFAVRLAMAPPVGLLQPTVELQRRAGAEGRGV